MEIAEQEIGAFRKEDAAAEKSADVHRAVFDAGEADVGVVTEVEFEVARERNVAGMDFQAEPRRTAATSAGCEHPAGDGAGGGVSFGEAGVGEQNSASGGKRRGEAMVERVTAEAEGG